MELEFILIMVAALGVTFMIQQFIARKAAARARKAQENSLEQEKAKLIRENITLGKQLSKKIHEEEILLEEYPFDNKNGIRIHRTTGVAFCNACLIDRNKKSPLKVETDGWYCPLCNVFIKNSTSNYDMGF